MKLPLLAVTPSARPSVSVEVSQRASTSVAAIGRSPIASVTVPEQGEAGRDGASTLSIRAAVTLGGHRVIRASFEGARYASVDQIESAGTVLGITIGATDEGEEVRFVAIGDLTEPSWNWTPGPIFCGLNGMLAQVPPPGVFEQQVATAITATRILVRVEPHVILAERS